MPPMLSPQCRCHLLRSAGGFWRDPERCAVALLQGKDGSSSGGVLGALAGAVTSGGGGGRGNGMMAGVTALGKKGGPYD